MKNFVNLLAKDKIIREFCLSLVSIANVLENVDVKVVSTRLAGTAIIIVKLEVKLNTKIGLHTHPPHPTTNFLKGSRPSRRLKFGIDFTHNKT